MVEVAIKKQRMFAMVGLVGLGEGGKCPAVAMGRDLTASRTASQKLEPHNCLPSFQSADAVTVGSMSPLDGEPGYVVDLLGGHCRRRGKEGGRG
jgi:hypothetical protein